MAEKVNKSYTSFHYHFLINLCVFYLSCHLAQRRAEALQFMILSRNFVMNLIIIRLPLRSYTVIEEYEKISEQIN